MPRGSNCAFSRAGERGERLRLRLERRDRGAERRAAAHQRRVAAAGRRNRGADLAGEAMRPAVDRLDPDQPARPVVEIADRMGLP